MVHALLICFIPQCIRCSITALKINHDAFPHRHSGGNITKEICDVLGELAFNNYKTSVDIYWFKRIW